jgi:hypothetical protein
MFVRAIIVEDKRRIGSSVFQSGFGLNINSEYFCHIYFSLRITEVFVSIRI